MSQKEPQSKKFLYKGVEGERQDIEKIVHGRPGFRSINGFILSELRSKMRKDLGLPSEEDNDDTSKKDRDEPWHFVLGLTKTDSDMLDEVLKNKTKKERNKTAYIKKMLAERIKQLLPSE